MSSNAGRLNSKTKGGDSQTYAIDVNARRCDKILFRN